MLNRPSTMWFVHVHIRRTHRWAYTRKHWHVRANCHVITQSTEANFSWAARVLSRLCTAPVILSIAARTHLCAQCTTDGGSGHHEQEELADCSRHRRELQICRDQLRNRACVRRRGCTCGSVVAWGNDSLSDALTSLR